MSRPTVCVAGWVYLAAGAMQAGCQPGLPEPDCSVRGRVLVGPSCPVVQVGEMCLDQPYPASLDVVNPIGRLVARREANDRGESAIALPEDSHLNVATAADEAPLCRAEPVEIAVRAGSWTEVTVTMDSGIQ